jgi:rhodanese-related sulfurtransferase
MIDVRRVDEFESELGYIENSINCVLDQLELKLKTFDRTKPTVMICRSGWRSAIATNIALEQGWAQVYNLSGGILLWAKLKLPLCFYEKKHAI